MRGSKLTALTTVEAHGAKGKGVAKANFDSIYEQPDPRAYFRELCGLDYIIPDLAQPVFAAIVSELERLRGRPLRVLDIGCSYGINAALLQFPIDLDRMARRYAELPESLVGPAQLAMLDRSYFRSWPRRTIEVVGLDASEPAINYARTTGVLHAGISGNFENAPLPASAREVLRGIDLVISTGAVGYVTERTMAKVLDAIGQPRPWFASFVLRMFPYDPIAQSLHSAGLVTERLAGATFIQRRFQTEGECSDVLARLEAMGIDTQGKESEGMFHAEFYLSRTPSDAAARPLTEMVSISQGQGHAFGRRFVRRAGEPIRLVR
jgi:SAM-dependent methyltransferase